MRYSPSPTSQSPWSCWGWVALYRHSQALRCLHAVVYHRIGFVYRSLHYLNQRYAWSATERCNIVCCFYLLPFRNWGIKTIGLLSVGFLIENIPFVVWILEALFDTRFIWYIQDIVSLAPPSPMIFEFATMDHFSLSLPHGHFFIPSYCITDFLFSIKELLLATFNFTSIVIQLCSNSKGIEIESAFWSWVQFDI